MNPDLFGPMLPGELSTYPQHVLDAESYHTEMFAFLTELRVQVPQLLLLNENSHSHLSHMKFNSLISKTARFASRFEREEMITFWNSDMDFFLEIASEIIDLLFQVPHSITQFFDLNIHFLSISQHILHRSVSPHQSTLVNIREALHYRKSQREKHLAFGIFNEWDALDQAREENIDIERYKPNPLQAAISYQRFLTKFFQVHIDYLKSSSSSKHDIQVASFFTTRAPLSVLADFVSASSIQITRAFIISPHSLQTFEKFYELLALLFQWAAPGGFRTNIFNDRQFSIKNRPCAELQILTCIHQTHGDDRAHLRRTLFHKGEATTQTRYLKNAAQQLILEQILYSELFNDLSKTYSKMVLQSRSVAQSVRIILETFLSTILIPSTARSQNIEDDENVYSHAIFKPLNHYILDIFPTLSQKRCGSSGIHWNSGWVIQTFIEDSLTFLRRHDQFYLTEGCTGVGFLTHHMNEFSPFDDKEDNRYNPDVVQLITSDSTLIVNTDTLYDYTSIPTVTQAQIYTGDLLSTIAQRNETLELLENDTKIDEDDKVHGIILPHDSSLVNNMVSEKALSSVQKHIYTTDCNLIDTATLSQHVPQTLQRFTPTHISPNLAQATVLFNEQQKELDPIESTKTTLYTDLPFAGFMRFFIETGEHFMGLITSFFEDSGDVNHAISLLEENLSTQQHLISRAHMSARLFIYLHVLAVLPLDYFRSYQAITPILPLSTFQPLFKYFFHLVPELRIRHKSPPGSPLTPVIGESSPLLTQQRPFKPSVPLLSRSYQQITSQEKTLQPLRKMKLNTLIQLDSFEYNLNGDYSYQYDHPDGENITAVEKKIPLFLSDSHTAATETNDTDGKSQELPELPEPQDPQESQESQEYLSFPSFAVIYENLIEDWTVFLGAFTQSLCLSFPSYSQRLHQLRKFSILSHLIQIQHRVELQRQIEFSFKQQSMIGGLYSNKHGRMQNVMFLCFNYIFGKPFESLALNSLANCFIGAFTHPPTQSSLPIDDDNSQLGDHGVKFIEDSQTKGAYYFYTTQNPYNANIQRFNYISINYLRNQHYNMICNLSPDLNSIRTILDTLHSIIPPTIVPTNPTDTPPTNIYQETMVDFVARSLYTTALYFTYEHLPLIQTAVSSLPKPSNHPLVNSILQIIIGFEAKYSDFKRMEWLNQIVYQERLEVQLIQKSSQLLIRSGLGLLTANVSLTTPIVEACFQGKFRLNFQSQICAQRLNLFYSLPATDSRFYFGPKYIKSLGNLPQLLNSDANAMITNQDTKNNPATFLYHFQNTSLLEKNTKYHFGPHTHRPPSSSISYIPQTSSLDSAHIINPSTLSSSSSFATTTASESPPNPQIITILDQAPVLPVFRPYSHYNPTKSIHNSSSLGQILHQTSNLTSLSFEQVQTLQSSGSNAASIQFGALTLFSGIPLQIEQDFLIFNSVGALVHIPALLYRHIIEPTLSSCGGNIHHYLTALEQAQMDLQKQSQLLLSPSTNSKISTRSRISRKQLADNTTLPSIFPTALTDSNHIQHIDLLKSFLVNILPSLQHNIIQQHCSKKSAITGIYPSLNNIKPLPLPQLSLRLMSKQVQSIISTPHFNFLGIYYSSAQMAAKIASKLKSILPSNLSLSQSAQYIEFFDDLWMNSVFGFATQLVTDTQIKLMELEDLE